LELQQVPRVFIFLLIKYLVFSIGIFTIKKKRAILVRQWENGCPDCPVYPFFLSREVVAYFTAFREYHSSLKTVHIQENNIFLTFSRHGSLSWLLS
jgi:hypothetical protein